MKANGSVNSQYTFALWQPAYAERGIATFPVEVVSIGGNQIKKPMISHYNKVGLRGSKQLAFKFSDVDMLGFMCGPRSKLTVLDIDSSNEAVLGHAIARHGITPIVVRTASGKWHAYYRHNGERRQIRPFPDLPIDILGGGGFVVAPPSTTASGRYEFMDGSLDDLDRLPIMQPIDEPSEEAAADGRGDNDNASANPLRGMREHDGRNRALFLTIAPIANQIHAAGGSRDALLTVAKGYNQEAEEPMTTGETTKIVDSVWRMTIAGLNRVGRHAFVMHQREAISLIEHGNQDALVLLNFLRANHGPLAAPFFITNTLASTFGWSRKRLGKARERLVELDYLRRIRPAWQKYPALYSWPELESGRN
jgi:hypothetical protein